MTWKDEILLREIELFETREPVEKGLGPRAPLPEGWTPIGPARIDHGRNLEQENRDLRNRWAYLCGELKHRSLTLSAAMSARDAATREAKRYRRAFTMASWTAAFWIVMAIIGWVR